LNIKNFTQKALSQIDNDTDILFPTNGQWQSLLSKLWSLNKKTKVVVSGQSGPGLDDRINLWTFPDKFVSLTTSQLNWSKKVNPFIKHSKVPNGVDNREFGNTKQKIYHGLNKPVVLTVAAFDKWKRIDLAIEAFNELKWPLKIVGSGFAKRRLMRLANSPIEFLDNLTDESLRD